MRAGPNGTCDEPPTPAPRTCPIRVGVVTERDLLDAIRDACRWSAVLVYHVFDSRRSEPGFPDCVLVGPAGVLFRELKSETGRLTPDQVRWLDRLTEANADTDVWRPCDWPTRVLAELADIGGQRLSTRRAS